MPSATLLGQALISGVLAGGMYGLLALGLSLSWGLLRLVNLSHFALAFLAAYLTYELGTTYHVAPWWSAMLIVPAMFAIGVAQHWLFDKFKVNELASLLITFSFAVILEVAIQLYWTADYRRFETHYSTLSIKAGPFYIPVLELVLCLVAGVLAWGTWLWLRRTYVGKALRAAAEDADIAAAYGVDHKKLAYLLSGMGAGYAGVAGTFIALIFYLVFFWVSLSTSWALLSGFAGYFSLGHAAFFGVGMYTTATLTTKFEVPFLATVPAAAAMAALLGIGIGAVVFRLKRLRGELFALLTLAVTFVIATIILNTPIDGGGGVFMSAVPLPASMGSQTGTIYVLGFVMCVLTLAIAWWVAHSRLGMGLFAIHDDEDVAEAKGVPTFHYKLVAFALSAGIAGAVGGIHAMYVGFLTVGGTFELTVPLYVVLMSVLGGARNWFGPAIGATFITTLLYAFISGGEAMVGRALVGLILIVAILWLPDGVVPAVQKWRRGRRIKGAEPAAAVVPAVTSVVAPSAKPASERNILEVRGVTKRFGGLQALDGVDLDVREGEILGLVGPNGSGKTTLINAISGFYPLTSGTIAVDGIQIGHLPAHEIAGRGVARTYQIPRPFVNMTVLDNVALAATFGGPVRAAAEIHDEAVHWIAFTGLAGKEQALPAELNLHERKFLELARALAARPKLLLLDEVLSGLNPAEVDNAIRLVRAIRAQGATIVFVEHLMRAVVELSDRVAVLNEGKLFALGAPREVMRDPRVVSIYLGKAYAA